MVERFALDIETVSPSLDHYERPPDFGDSQYFEVLAVVLGYEGPEGKRESEMLFRESTEPRDELTLLKQTCEWIDDRAGETCLTYGGAAFDLPQLVGRAEAAGEVWSESTDTVERITRLFEDGLNHVDLQPAAWNAFGEYTRLEEACEAVGLETTDTEWARFEHGVKLDELRPPKYQGFEKVINSDVPVFGERYLELADVGATDTVTFQALRNLLDHYGREDVIHLFELADARPFQETARV